MTRDPHCDGCKADDKLRALRRERDELQARLDALGPVGYRYARLTEDGKFYVERRADRATHRQAVAMSGEWRPVSPETTP